MGLESPTSNFLSQLNQSYPLSGDARSEGDDHIRLIKRVLQLTFPGVDGNGFKKAITATEDEINFLSGVTSSIQTQLANVVPAGVIVMWSGTIATIPAGWHLCDGTNGTPNLKDKFIIGASVDQTVAKTNVTGTPAQSGGSKDAVNVAHVHAVSITSASDSHFHYNAANIVLTVDAALTASNQMAMSRDVGDGSQNYTAQGTSTAATIGKTSTDSHTHAVSGNTASAGVTGTNANLPPFFALAYIQKL